MNKLTYYSFSLVVWLLGADSLAQTVTPIRERGVRRLVSEVSEAQLTVSGHYLYFVGREPSTGSELWRTDGTPEGTRLVKDITPGPQVGDTAPVSLLDANGTLYFFVGTSLYKTDGSEAGTVLLGTFGDIGGANLLLYKDLVIFKVLGGIWRTDGTPEGTFQLNSRGDAPLLYKDHLYFYTASGPTFQQTDLFRSDGTREGTSQVTQFSGTLQSIGVGVDGLYLTLLTGNFHPTPGQWSTWKSDGTAGGTRQVGSTSTTSQPSYFQVAGELYQRQNFTGSQPTFRQNRTTGAFEAVLPTPTLSVLRRGANLADGERYGSDYTPATGTELTRLDGTTVRDLNPGPGTGIVYGPVAFNGLLYFAGSNAAENFELWQSDGTSDGTRLTVEQRPGARGSYPLNLTVFRGALYFDTWEGTLWKLSADPIPPVAPPTDPGALSLRSPAYDCIGGGLTLQLSGVTDSPIEYRVVGLRDWSTRADFIVPAWQRNGTTFTLEVRYGGQILSQPFTTTCQPTPSPSGTALRMAPPQYDCSSGQLTLSPSGGTGLPIEYRIVGLRDWTTSNQFLIPPWQRTGTTFTLDMRQDGQFVTGLFTTACGPARLASPESDAVLEAVLYPNPVDEQFSVVVKGARGQTVRFVVTDLRGRTLLERGRRLESTQHTETVPMPSGSSAGVYLLRISTDHQTKTLKVVKR